MTGRIEEEIPSVPCSKCGVLYKLSWQTWRDEPETMEIGYCQSGGVYSVTLRCPNCKHEVEL